MNKKKVLLVDDEVDFVKMVKMRLEANDYEVLTAYNGKEFLEKVKKVKPDMILLDILMPEMDGYTALKELKQLKEAKDIPVIILTAKGKMKDLFQIENIADYIVKPFDDDELLLRMKRVLATSKNGG